MGKSCFIYFLLFAGYLTLSGQGLFEAELSESAHKSELPSGFLLSGYARGSVWGGSERYDFSNVFGEFSLQGRIPEGRAFLSADLRIREGLFFGDRKTVVEIKEAIAGYRGNKFDFFAGNQIVNWGRADGFNPTNNINANDYFFQTNEPDDQILSNFMLRSKYRFSRHTELEALVIPLFKPSVYRYDLFDLGHGVIFSEASLPSMTLQNCAMAARLNIELSRIGFSFSWFHGYDPFHGFNLKSIELIPEREIVYQADFYKKDAVGFDYAIPVLSTIFRGEFAYNFTRDYEDKMFIPNPYLFGVLGIERDLSGFTTILQYIGKRTFSFKPLDEPLLLDPNNPIAQMQYANELITYESMLFNRKIFNQQKEFNHAMLVSVNRYFAHDILNAELSFFYDFISEEYLLRSKLTWNLADSMSAFFGLSIMQGPDNSVFNKAGKVLNGFFSGLKVSF